MLITLLHLSNKSAHTLYTHTHTHTMPMRCLCRDSAAGSVPSLLHRAALPPLLRRLLCCWLSVSVLKKSSIKKSIIIETAVICLLGSQCCKQAVDTESNTLHTYVCTVKSQCTAWYFWIHYYSGSKMLIFLLKFQASAILGFYFSCGTNLLE